MEITILNIEKESVKLNATDLLTFMSGNGEAIDQYTLNLTKNLIGECQKVMAPKGAFGTMKAIPTPSGKEIAFTETKFCPGRAILKMLKGSEQFLFFVATAGPGPENLSKNLIAEGQYLEGYIVDLIGSAIAEAAAQSVHDHLKELSAQTGFKITNRYSPGYCGWTVNEQQKLFGLFPKKVCGITLSESSLMHPIKSISGMVGAGPEVTFRSYTCEICSMKDCIFRQTKALNRSLSG